MSNRVVLDTGPLGMLTHPRASKAAAEWFLSMLQTDCEVIIPEIADYEVRRNMILEKMTESIERLDLLKKTENVNYLPIDTPTMLLAASLWAEARQRHKPTADKHALDGDVILAAQAKRAGAVVATDNVGHLDQFVQTRKWRDMGFSGDKIT